MSWPSVAASRVLALFARSRLERRLDHEVRFHIEMETEANLARGMNPRDAQHAALRSFGGVDATKEIYRERRALPLIETTMQDIRYALRSLRRAPAFAVAAIAVLALAIAANTAMFSVIHAVILKPLPLPDPDRLAVITTGSGRSTLQLAQAWREHSRSIASLAVSDIATVTVISGGDAFRVRAARCSPEYFGLTGIQPVLGRLFTAEDALERRRYALLGHELWQQRFGGSRDALGATVEINGSRSTVIGILPPKLDFPKTIAIWEPYTLSPGWDTGRFWSVLVRLRPGVPLHQATAEVDAIARRLDPVARGATVTTLARTITGPRERLALWLLAGAVFAVLLIASANVAGLVLARSAARQREFNTRFALGASRSRIVRQLLAESLTLATIAGVLGILLADGILRAIILWRPAGLERLDTISLDLRALAASALFCLVCAALVGLAPAFTLGRRVSGPVGRGLRRSLVAAEFAIAIVLLTGAGLLLRSLWSLQSVDHGFRTDRVLVVAAAAPSAGFYEPALARIQALPGVETAAIASDLFTASAGVAPIAAEGAEPEPVRFRSDEVSDGFFRTIGAPLVRGRFFSPGDGRGEPKVALVNETMARRLWPTSDPIGRRFRAGIGAAAGPWFTVVGVVRDIRRQGPEAEPIAQMFEPLAQNPPRGHVILVRSVGPNPLALAPAVEAAVHEVSKLAPVYGITTAERQLADYLAPRRLQTTLVVAFSAMALLIAAIGIYGLVQYSVTARTREIGIRVAIGSPAGQIFFLILREGMTLGFAGLCVGMLAALALSRAGASLLYGISATDPLTFLAVAAVLLTVAAAACYFPARRAMKLDPVRALRLD